MDGNFSSCKIWIILQILTCLIVLVISAKAKIKGTFKCTPPRHTAITCWTTNLPTVTEGYFDCAPNSTVSKGEVCSLKCNDRFYPAYSNQTVCETGTTNQGGVWSNGSFVCREITCLEDLLQPQRGELRCPSPPIREGDACNLTCSNDTYPFPSNEAVCRSTNSGNGGGWFPQSFDCRDIKCNDWNEWNGSEYKYISTKQNWEESRQLCESDNSHLVNIGNKEENEFVHKIVWHCHQYYQIWIGLNDRNTEDTWEWSEGTVSTYRNWRKGEPNGDAEECVHIYRGDGKWNDIHCCTILPAVCERNNLISKHTK